MVVAMLICMLSQVERQNFTLPQVKAALLAWDMPGRSDNGKVLPGGIVVWKAVWNDGTIVWIDQPIFDAMKRDKRPLCRISHIDPQLVKVQLNKLFQQGYFKAAGWWDIDMDGEYHSILVRTHGKVLTLSSAEDPPRRYHAKNWKYGWASWKLAHEAVNALRPPDGPLIAGPDMKLFWKWEGEQVSKDL